MGIDYVLIAGLLLYFGVIKLMSVSQLKPLQAAAIVVVGYYALSTTIRAILYSVYNVSFWEVLLDPIRLAGFPLQFTATFLIFREMQQRGSESYGMWVAWSIAGCVTVFFLAPYIVARLVGY